MSKSMIIIDTPNSCVTCPDCGKQLEFMSGYNDGYNLVALFHCKECKDGIDSDWEITYTEENEIKRIRRYFFG